MRCIFIDDKYISFFDGVFFLVDNVGGVTAQHKNKLREICVGMEKHIFIMMTVLNKKRKILLCSKIVKVHFRIHNLYSPVLTFCMMTLI